MTELTESATYMPGADPEPDPESSAWWARRRARRERRQQIRSLNASAGSRRNVPATVLAAAMLAVELVVAYESFAGLVGFAHMIGIPGLRANGVPITFDGVAIIAALLSLRAELAGESSGLYRLTMLAFTAASAAANVWHGLGAGGAGTALYYGGMSLAVTWLFMLSLRQIRADDRRRAALVTERLPRFSGWHWGRYPGRTFTAWSLSIRDGHKTSREALDAASAHIDAKRETKMAAELPPLELTPEALLAMSARDRLAVAFGAVGAIDVPKALALLADKGAPVDQSHAYQVRRQIEAARAGEQS
jgi:hypothetical protein